jgi:RsmE family RNA methyltransferase
MNIILVSKEEVGQDQSILLEGRRFEHIKNVLKPAVGDFLRVGVIGEDRYQAELVDISNSQCNLRLVDRLQPFSEPSLDLILALPRPKCMKRLWAQLSAVGFKRIFIVNAEKVEKVYWGSTTLLEEVYKPLLLEGLEQCGDTILPEVRFVKRLRPFLEDEVHTLFANQQKVIAHPYNSGVEEAILADVASVNSRKVIAVGPEGGWNDFEISLFAKAGFKSFSLGERILRTDTAVIALAALLK